MRVDRDRREARVAGVSVGVDHGCEVIAHCRPVCEMDRDPSADGQEWPEAQLGDALDVVSGISAGVFAD
jgi:hypothetical protein